MNTSGKQDARQNIDPESKVLRMFLWGAALAVLQIPYLSIITMLVGRIMLLIGANQMAAVNEPVKQMRRILIPDLILYVGNYAVILVMNLLEADTALTNYVSILLETCEYICFVGMGVYLGYGLVKLLADHGKSGKNTLYLPSFVYGCTLPIYYALQFIGYGDSAVIMSIAVLIWFAAVIWFLVSLYNLVKSVEEARNKKDTVLKRYQKSLKK